MGVFIFLFSTLFFLYISTIKNQNKTSNRLIQTLFCFSLLVMIQALRHSTVGIDSCAVYLPYFESVEYGVSSILDLNDVASGFEIGFVIFTKLIKTIFNNTQFYFFCCSIVSIAPFAYLIYKYADNIPFAFIIYSSLLVYYFGFSGIRQSMAIGVTGVAFEFLIRNKLVPFIIVTLIASYIHTSAILFIFSYPLYHYLRLTPAKLFFIGCLFIIISFSLKSIVVYLVDMIFSGEKYIGYIMNEVKPSYNLMIMLTLILIFTFTIKNERINRLRTMLFVSIR